ncbi:MAG: hydantoinase/oxoprolinase family protein [Actinomycetota bacterium]
MRIGIDTGGTYTDAVRVDEQRRVVAAAKARTRPDLSIGIAEALDAVLGDPDEVSLVCLSTTLATNALVEGVGGRVGLVLIGFEDADLDRGGLRDGLGEGPVLLAAGGHDPLGNEVAPFDGAAVSRWADGLAVDAFAVAGQFSVRNPGHEEAARDLLRAIGTPVACSHELSAKLNAPRRALTCLLNARLIGLIDDLHRAAQTILADRGIAAPLMIVRGDGSLVAGSFAVDRPIETILSGPAASLIGAGHLSDLADVIVSDIGGTTTDVGVLRNGRPTVSVEGATVGGHRTMVEAVEMFTSGLGGDSEVRLDHRAATASLAIGPRRVTPLSLLGTLEPDLVHRTLAARTYPFRDHDIMFAAQVDPSADQTATGPIGERERKVLAAIGDGWAPLDSVATSNLEASSLRALVARWQVRLAGFTPTDAAHVLGLHDAWDAEAAARAATLLAAASDAAGNPVRPDGEALARWVVETLVRRSAEAVLGATLAIDGFTGVTIDTELVRRALDGHRGVTDLRVAPALPLLGLGASAATYYPAVAELLGTAGVVPTNAEVANAVGAAVGRVRVVRTTTISQPSKGQFRIHLPNAGPDLGNLEPTLERAAALLTDEVRGLADDAGAAEVTIEVDVIKKTAMVEGREVFVEGTVTVTGAGDPRVRARLG